MIKYQSYELATWVNVIRSKKRTYLFLVTLSIACMLIWFLCTLYVKDQNDSETELVHDSGCSSYGYTIDDFLVRPNESPRFYERLPNLIQLKWPMIEYAALPIRKAPLPEAFEPMMSRAQRFISKKLLDLFVEHMIANGLSDKYLLCGATMLGSFRHHNFVPWDDDIDVMVDVNLRPVVQKIFGNMKPEFILDTTTERDKLHTKLYESPLNKTDVPLSRAISEYSWGWPYLDINYFRRNSTHTCEAAETYGVILCWPNSVIFPLSYRPFGSKWYPAPRDPLMFLQRSYGSSNMCEVYGYSHALESSRPDGSVACRQLGQRYSFVEHGSPDQSESCSLASTDDNQIVWSRESLVIRTDSTHQAVIHSIPVPVPKHNLRVETYGLNYRLDQPGQ